VTSGSRGRHLGGQPSAEAEVAAGVLISAWMARKATSVGEVRGLLAVPADTDQAAYERSGYVRALRGANAAPW